MRAGSATRRSNSCDTADEAQYAPRTSVPADGPRGGIVWITGVAGVTRAGLVTVARTALDDAWDVDVIAPDEVDAWIGQSARLSGRVAIVVATAASAITSAQGRAQAHAAGFTLTEIVVAADWDAFVERSDRHLLAQLTTLFGGRGRAASARTAVAPPDAIVRPDWHGARQIESLVVAALTRAGLVPLPCRHHAAL